MQTTNTGSFGVRLKSLRESHNMTIKELSEQVGLSEGTISRYENGKIEAKRTTIRVIAELFRVNPAWLIGYEGAEKYTEAEGRPNTKMIPVLGSIAAGVPILALCEADSYEYVPLDDPVDFCLRVKGDSMINARIFDGDLVYLRQQPEVENGEIAAVVVNCDEVTLKRFYRFNGSVVLRSENPLCPEMIFDRKQSHDVHVVGKVIRFKSEVR